MIRYAPDQSVVRLNIGNKIRITAEEFERLSAAFFTEMECKFLESCQAKRYPGLARSKKNLT